MPRNFWKTKLLFPFFSILTGLAFLEIILRLAGGVWAFQNERSSHSAANTSSVVTVLCLGESTTFMGERNSYPRLMEHILNADSSHRQFRVINKGVPSITTEGILSELKANLARYHPDMVVAMMGVNDRPSTKVYTETPWTAARLALANLRVWKMTKLIAVYGYYHWTQAMAGWVGNLPWRYFHPGSAYEQFMLEEIIAHPKDTWSYEELAEDYRNNKRWQDAERIGWFAVVRFPKKKIGYNILIRLYEDQGQPAQAEYALERCLKINPKKSWAYQLAGEFRAQRGDYSGALEMIRQGLEFVSVNDRPLYYQSRGRILQQAGDYEKAVAAYEEAIRLNPEESISYMELSEVHETHHHRKDSNEVLLRWGGRSKENYDKVVKWFLAKENMERVKDFLKEARLRFPDNARVLEIENIFKKDPQQYATPRITEPPGSPYIWGYSPVTVVNYRKFADILAQRNIKLISVQYPIRSVAPLQIILQGKPVWAFVDNEETFQQVLKRENFQEYFSDRFGRHFGHCTAKGNQLLAENVARVILEKIKE